MHYTKVNENIAVPFVLSHSWASSSCPTTTKLLERRSECEAINGGADEFV